MKLVIDLQALQGGSRQHGIGRYSLCLSQALAKLANKHELYLLFNSTMPEITASLQARFQNWIPESHIKIFEIPYLTTESQKNQWQLHATEILREHFIASLNPDIVHISSLFEGDGNNIISSVHRLSSPIVTTVTLYDLIPLVRAKEYLTTPEFSKYYFRKLQALKSADALLAISEFSRQEAIETLGISEDRIVNCSAGVNPQFTVRSTVNKHRVLNVYGIKKSFILYNGGFDFRKNIDGLIKAFALLPTHLKKTYQLVIVGDVPEYYKRSIQLLIKKLSLESSDIIVTGYITDEELITFYNVCSVFVLPSFHEGFGLPALEAMACGAPTIASNVSSLPEIIGLHDALFDPHQPDSIAKKISHVLSDTHFQNFLKNHGPQQAKKFSWDHSAKKALDTFEMLHEETTAKQLRLPSLSYSSKPSLAYISPLPPEETGVANYSAELLPELDRFYHIVLITDQKKVDYDWLNANFSIKNCAWFVKHAKYFRHVIYNVANSSFHGYMFQLIKTHPGIVILHDFFLSDVLSWIENRSLPQHAAFSEGLYQSHGISSLYFKKKYGDLKTLQKYPANLAVLKNAMGVIVHSQHVIDLARKWYGTNIVPHLQYIPLLARRKSHSAMDKQLAKKRLGFKENDFLVCSFGFITPHKLIKELILAWLNTPLAQEKCCYLIFVGKYLNEAYAKTLFMLINNSPLKKNIRITGFEAKEKFKLYLMATDIAVQLRTQSRGETSACLLNCLAHGIPSIINSHGSADEILSDVAIKLADRFTREQLETALIQLRTDVQLRTRLSQKALAYIQENHSPTKVGQLFQSIIHYFSKHNILYQERSLINTLAHLSHSIKPTLQELADTASTIATHRPRLGLPQLLIDISMLQKFDENTGIQRVVHSILITLIKNPPKNFRVEAIYDTGKGYYNYACRFVLRTLKLQDNLLEDTPIECYPGDIFLGLDFYPQSNTNLKKTFENWRGKGIKIYFVVYDLLPLLKPIFFNPTMESIFYQWLKALTEIADGVACISQTLANELQIWLQQVQPSRTAPLKISVFGLSPHIVDDTDEDYKNSIILTKTDKQLLKTIASNQSFLMVGRVEPHKGHTQALDAFEQLWKRRCNLYLIIVGKKGWGVDSLVKRIKNHPEYNKRLICLENTCGKFLEKIYQCSTALLAASEAEGFGLPLIEAAYYNLSIIARDIPIFKELIGTHAFYFEGYHATDLAGAIENWISLRHKKSDPKPSKMQHLTWKESTEQLLDILLPNGKDLKSENTCARETSLISD